MENEIKIDNIVSMLKETANFCRDVRQIYIDLCLELGNNNLLSKSEKPITEKFFFEKEGEKGWIDYNFFFKTNNTVNGFRLLLACENTSNYERYQKITDKLRIDKKIPLLLIYGTFLPVESIQKSIKSIQFIQDTCCGFISQDDEEYDWVNFDEENIVWNTDISIEMKEWTTEIEEDRGYPTWNNYFSKAKIRYKPLLDIRNYEGIKKLADEIKAMTF